MPLFTVKSKKYASLPTGAYEAKFDGLEEYEPNEDSRSFKTEGKTWSWRFTIDKGEYAGQRVSVLADEPATPENKMGRFVCAIANQPLKDGVEVNPDDYVGRLYMLVVSPLPKKPEKTGIVAFSLIA